MGATGVLVEGAVGVTIGALVVGVATVGLILGDPVGAVGPGVTMGETGEPVAGTKL
jgi:hypothetical protein